jgi:hypothetical protein
LLCRFTNENGHYERLPANVQRSRKNLRGTWRTPQYERLLPGMGVTLGATTVRLILVGFDMEDTQEKENLKKRTDRIDIIDLAKEKGKEQEKQEEEAVGTKTPELLSLEVEKTREKLDPKVVAQHKPEQNGRNPL